MYEFNIVIREAIMILGMSEDEAQVFLEKVSATTIVNQAIIKCSLSGLPVTHDNIVFLVGDFFPPTDPSKAGVIIEIQRAIDEVLATADLIRTRRNSSIRTQVER